MSDFTSPTPRMWSLDQDSSFTVIAVYLAFGDWCAARFAYNAHVRACATRPTRGQWAGCDEDAAAAAPAPKYAHMSDVGILMLPRILCNRYLIAVNPKFCRVLISKLSLIILV